MASKTFVNGGVNSNWSTAGNWSPVASVPANGDDVFLGATSPNCVVDVATNGLKSFDMNGYTATLSGAAVIKVVAAANTTTICRFAGTITWTGGLQPQPNATNGVIQFYSGGKTLAATTQSVAGGKVMQMDALTLTGAFGVSSGWWVSNGYSLTVNSFASSGTGVRTIDIAGSLVSVSGAGTAWNMANTTGLTFIATGSTVTFTNTISVAVANTAGPPVTFGDVVFTGAGSYILTWTANGTTVANFTLSSAPKNWKITAGATVYITGAFTAIGSLGHVFQLTTSVAGGQATLSKASGIVLCDWLNVRDSIATGGAAWYAGSNSVGNNTSGWAFTDGSALRDFVGELIGAATSAAALAVARILSGGAAGSGATSPASAVVVRGLGGAVAGQGAVSALPIKVVRLLAGGSAGKSVASGGLAVTRTLAGAAAGTGTATASLAVLRSLAGAVAGRADAWADLSVLAASVLRDFAGSATGSSAATAGITVRRDLHGDATGRAAASAALTALRNMAGTAAGAASLEATLRVLRWLAGEVDGAAVTAADLWTISRVVQPLHIEGAAFAIAVAQAALARPRATAELGGYFGGRIDPPPVALGTITASGMEP